MSNVMCNGRSCEIDCLNSSLAPKSVPMADEGWRGRRRLDVWPSTDAVPAPPTELPPSPIRRPLHRHPHPQPRCHSLASTALTTTLTATLALAPATWAPRVHSVVLCLSRPHRSVIQSDLLSSPTLDPSTSASLVDVDVAKGMFGRITDRRGWETQRSALFLMPQDPWTRVQ